MPDIGLTAGFDLAFQGQIDFFRNKIKLPTAKWDDIRQAAHDRAFVVAGAAKADLLNDLFQAVSKAIETGTTLETFRKDFRKIVADRGWQGWTGEGTPGGFAWRTRVIYETNLRTSYAAGREAQLADPGLQKLMPYRRYVHNDSVLNPRPQHLAWNGLTLPHDHPFWKTHSPPNGWGCRCRVVAALKPKAGDATTPPTGWDALDGETGAPVGIDKGWAYAPGASWHPNLDKYPYPMARQIVADNLGDGVFSRWVDKINHAVSSEFAKPEYRNLEKTKAVAALRKALGGEEHYPAAILPPPWRDRLGVETQVLKVSDYDLVKQAVSRQGQDFEALSYMNVQQVLDSPRLVVRENSQMSLFVSDASGKWFVAVIQQTKSGAGVFLKSFRRSSEKDARLQAKKGEVLESDL